MSFRFQFRRGTTAERDAVNPILAAGEPAVVLDSGQPAVLVLGDGVTQMADLPPVGDLAPALDAVAAESARADATFRPLVSLAPLKRALNAGTRSVAVQVLGDSTGNDTGEWPDLFSQYLAAQYPAFTVQRRTWSDATQDYGAPVTVQTGTAGPLYQDCSGSVTTGSFRGASSVHLSGTIDVRVKLTAPDWTPATARMIAGQMGLSGTRSWALCLSAAGLPQIMYSTDGAAIAMMSNSAITGLADGATKWLRAVFTPNDGAGNRVLKCYLSDDGLTWTQLGSTVTTAGALTLFNAATDDPYSGFGLGGTAVGAYQPWIGQIHEVDIRDGLDGKSVAPRLPDLWSHIAYSTPTASAPVVGAPVLTIVNGSHPGGNIAYLGDATRLPKMTPDYGQALVLTSNSHNERSRVGVGWRTYYATWLGAIAARLVGVPAVILTQNPENGADNATTHAQRRLDLLAFGHATGRDVIDTYAAFLAAGDWTALLADTIHPNATGSQVWADTVTDTFAATSV